MICYFLVFAISPTIVRTKAIMQVIVKIFQGKYAGAGEVRISIQSVCPWGPGPPGSEIKNKKRPAAVPMHGKIMPATRISFFV